MKRTLLVIAVIALSLGGCGGDSGTSPQTGEDRPLAADTIGTEGGTLMSDDFELSVPAGAFDGDAELELYESSEDHELGETCVSRFFRLEGLPETFDDTLTVRIAYEGSLSGSSYVVTGEKAAFYGDDLEAVEGFIYSYHLATESSGHLEARIPPRTAGLKGSPNSGSASTREEAFASITGVDVHKTSEHFRVRYPLSVFSLVDDVVSYLEAAHDTVESIGMGFAGKDWEWPAKIFVTELSGAATVRFSVTSKGLHILYRTSHLTENELPRARRLLGNNIVRAAQNIPDESEFLNSDHIPWHMAVMCYLQQKWTAPGTFTRPGGFGGNERYALGGLPVGIPHPDGVEVGVGWSPVVKHLAGLYGRKIIGDIYKVTQTTAKKPIKVLFEEVPDPAYNWWPQFVDKYVTGQYYGVEAALLLSHIESGDKYTIASASDTLKTFTHDSRQLSARMHRVYLGYALIADDATLELTLSATSVNEDYYTLMVYKAKDGVLELVGAGNPVTVTGLKDLTIAGYDIIPIEVLSYNDEPYTDKVSTELRCRVTSPPPYTWAYISFNDMRAHLEDSYANDWYDDHWNAYWEGSGSWNGNTFTASWTNRPLPSVGSASGSLAITIDPITRDVVNFRAAETRLSTTGFTYVDSIVGGHVPFEYQSTGHRLCQVVGTGVCSSITSYAYRRDDPGSAWIELDTHHCLAATYLNVNLAHESDK